MSWLHEPAAEGHLREACTHFSAVPSARTATEACDRYFRGFNRLWNAHAIHQGEPDRADIPAFIAMLCSLPEEVRASVLRSDAVSRLADLSPPVLDHHRLKKHGYRPGATLEDKLLKKATEQHQELRRALTVFKCTADETTSRKGMKRLAEFLFVVRSNIAHGEKTPYGTDLEKTRRDEEVSAAARSVLALLQRTLLVRDCNDGAA